MERLIYPENHWARSEYSDNALKQYLSMYNNAYNRTKVRLIEEILRKLNGTKILGYGGGAGYMSVFCAEKRADIVLVDAEKMHFQQLDTMLERNKLRTKLSLYVRLVFRSSY